MLDEVKTGDRPSGVAISRDGRRGVVTHWFGYDIGVLEIKGDKISLAARVEVGPEPRGVAISADGKTAYVAVGVSNEIARVDLDGRKVTGRLPVGREPRDCVFPRRVTPLGRQFPVAQCLDHRRQGVEGPEHDSHRRR